YIKGVLHGILLHALVSKPVFRCAVSMQSSNAFNTIPFFIDAKLLDLKRKHRITVYYPMFSGGEKNIIFAIPLIGNWPGAL
ncbi:MAG: hypothetical protein P8016_05085, partial [Sedimentisphaerales bacterium]